MGRKVFTNSFAGGEQSPLMLGHIEDVGYRTGYASGLNGLVLPTGAWTRRPHFAHVKAAKPGVTQIRMLPFVYGNGDSYAMEWGPNSVRFHTGGATLKYATAIPVSDINLTSDTFATSSAHGLAVNDAVRITHKGTSIPGNLATGTIYYVRTVPTSTTFTLSASAGPGSLLDLTTNATLDETSFWKQSELPREYVTSRTFTASTINNILTTASAHGLVSTHGDPVHFTTTGTLPSPLVAGRAYYARYFATDQVLVAPTKEDAIAGTNLIVILTAGSGTHTFHYGYRKGDIVWGGSLTILASTSSRLFWSDVDLPTALPTVSGWHQMPADGTYELLHGLGAEGLASLAYDQSFDVFSFVTSVARPYTLIRDLSEAPSGSSTTSETVRWAFRPIDLPAVLDAPTPTLSGRVFGEYYNVTWPTTHLNTCRVTSTPTEPHAIQPFDVVYMEADIGVGNAIPDIAGTPGLFFVTQTGNPGLGSMRMRRIEGGDEVVNASSPSANRTGAIRVASSSSETSHEYVVSSVADNGDESEPSSPLTVVNILETPGSSNTIVWSAVDGAARYRIYRKFDEVFGLIGETDLLTFTDDGIEPDNTAQPVVIDESLVTEWPAAVGNFQLRQWFGGTEEHPRRVWASKSGTQSTMSYHERTLLDTDRIRFDVAVRERSLIRHIVAAYHLWLLLSSGEVRVSGPDGQRAIVASKPPDLAPVSSVGSSPVRPIVAGTSILFVGDRTQHVYELPAQATQLLEPPDLSVRSHHLFDGYTITESAQQKAPFPIEWYLRSDGKLLGMTYMPEQNVRGWHLHEVPGTAAEVLSFCVVPEEDGDRLYAAVARTVNGSTYRSVERMGLIEDPASMSACGYLDSRVTYSGAAATSIPVAHLEGQSVYAVADGQVVGPLTVASGIVTLSRSANTVHVGLLPTSRGRSLPAALLIEGYGKGHQLKAMEVSMRVQNSCPFSVRLHVDDGQAQRTPYPVTGLSVEQMRNRDIRTPIEGSWNAQAQVEWECLSPLPLTVVSMTLDVEVGG